MSDLPMHPLVAFLTGAIWSLLQERAGKALAPFTVDQPTQHGQVVPWVLVSFNKGKTVLRVNVELVQDTFGVGGK